MEGLESAKLVQDTRQLYNFQIKSRQETKIIIKIGATDTNVYEQVRNNIK